MQTTERNRPTDQALGPRRLSTHPATADAPEPDLPGPGTRLGHYELIRLLGRGGMGSVHLARDLRLGRRVAIKFLTSGCAQVGEHFRAEARTTARCQHPNIVIIHDLGEYHSRQYMVLEYVAGQTLRDWLTDQHEARDPGHQGGSRSRQGRASPAGVTPARAVELMVPVVRALVRAHGMGIVHRDLKPGNIMLARDGQVKVLDFGVAMLRRVAFAGNGTISGEGAVDNSLTVSLDGASAESWSFTPSTLVGTPEYMSPEQLEALEVDHQSDIWAVGVMLYEMVMGAHPLGSCTAGDLLEAADLEVPMPRVSELFPEAGPLAGVIDRCLLKDKCDRIADARALLAELEPLLPGHGRLSLTDDESPFVGLRAFKESDADRYHGRDDDIRAVVGRVRERPMVAVIGPSGAGKSSLVRAGVIPALERSGEGWQSFTTRPGRSPLAALAQVLDRIQRSSASWGSGLHKVENATAGDRNALAGGDDAVARLRTEPGYLGATLRGYAQRKLLRVLLFIDQFEELYTLCADDDERAAFLAGLAGAADDADSPVRVALSMRADFLERVAENRSFMTLATPGLMLLPPMGRAGLRAALTEPLRAVGYRYERAGLVGNMLRELATTHGALPLLQFAATSLWERRDRERRLLTVASYEAMGGIGGALAKHADRVLAGMPAASLKLARLVFERLVTPERTRALVGVTELLDATDDFDAMEQVIHELADARLLHLDSGERGSTIEDSVVARSLTQLRGTVELVHESLIGSWPTLQGWLDENRQDVHFLARVRSAAREWRRHGRTDDLLWRGQAALDAGRWRERAVVGAGELGRREREFLDAVVALATRTRRRRRMLVVAGFALLSAIAVMIALLAARADREASQARASEAKERRSAAEAQASAARAAQQAAGARNASRLASAALNRSDATLVLALVREMETQGPLPPQWRELARWATHREIAQVVLTHEELIYAAAFSPDGRRIVTASRDKIARVWSADGTGQPILLAGHQDRVYSAAFSPDGTRIVTASRDKTARVWNADGAGQPTVLAGHQDAVYSAVFSPDGTRIVTASRDTHARVWNVDGAGEPILLAGHRNGVTAAAFSPDGKRIVTASWDRTARIWNADSTDEPIVLAGHQDMVYSTAFSPDGTRIVTASADKTARVWNTDGTGEPIVLSGHQDVVHSAVFSPDSMRIVTASADKSARIWNADGTDQPILLTGHEALLHSAAFSRDGTRIVTASFDKTARVWNAAGEGQPIHLSGHQDDINSAAFCPDGTHVVTASSDRTARVWNIDGTGRPIVLAGHQDVVHTAAFSPDSKRIVTASSDRTARVWNADGTGQSITLVGHQDLVYSAAFSPDGKLVVTASFDNTARVWNADGTGKPIVLSGHEDGLYSAAFSPDGTRIVTASFDNTARVWRADGTGESIVLAGHQDDVSSAAFSPDGTRIVTTSFDRTARVWRLDQLKADGSLSFVTLRGHESLLSNSGAPGGGGAFSPDGTRVLTISQDKTLRIWNADGTGEPAILRIPELSASSAAFSPDGTRIVTASHSERDPATGEMKHWATVWPSFARFTGLDDPALWTATRYCPPPELREKLLGKMPPGMAEARFQRCQERVEAAFAVQAADAQR